MSKHSISVIAKLAHSDAGTVRFTLSDRTADRAGDTIEPSGWRLENYKRNPVVLWGHDSSIPAIGRMSSLRVDGGALVGDVEFADGTAYPLAKTVADLVRGGFLRAGSVGFAPLRWEQNADGGYDFKEQELLEFSIVNIPCNPRALVGAKDAGIDLTPIRKSLSGAAWADSELFETLFGQSAESAVKSPDFGRHKAAVSDAVCKLMRF